MKIIYNNKYIRSVEIYYMISHNTIINKKSSNFPSILQYTFIYFLFLIYVTSIFIFNYYFTIMFWKFFNKIFMLSICYEF